MDSIVSRHLGAGRQRRGGRRGRVGRPAWRAGAWRTRRTLEDAAPPAVRTQRKKLRSVHARWLHARWGRLRPRACWQDFAVRAEFQTRGECAALQLRTVAVATCRRLLLSRRRWAAEAWRTRRGRGVLPSFTLAARHRARRRCTTCNGLPSCCQYSLLAICAGGAALQRRSSQARRVRQQRAGGRRPRRSSPAYFCSGRGGRTSAQSLASNGSISLLTRRPLPRRGAPAAPPARAGAVTQPPPLALRAPWPRRARPRRWGCRPASSAAARA
jgi:hypothetical protein